jgi:hypothetical protein
MSKIEIENGQKFGRLTVISNQGFIDGFIRYECKCDCGNTKVIPKNRLLTGNTKSCGCLRRDVTGQMRKTHNMSKTRLNRIWRAMKYRCNSPNGSDHAIYHDRGIRVCDEWKNDFMSFYTWSMNNGYREDLSIDRIDNDKGYSPNNCRWATIQEQRHNQRRCYGN